MSLSLDIAEKFGGFRGSDGNLGVQVPAHNLLLWAHCGSGSRLETRRFDMEERERIRERALRLLED